MSQAPKSGPRFLFRKNRKIQPAPEAEAPPRNEPLLVIQGAREIIQDFGWRRGRMGNKNTGFCLIGALHESAKTQHLSGKALHMAEKHVHEMLPGSYQSLSGHPDKAIMRYNDHALHNHVEVDRLLHGAQQVATFRHRG